MAKLARIHLAGMGNASARFNPVHLDFRIDGDPTHAVMWLRNGGGKTTLLSLLYSVLLPHKNDWLGRHNDRQTELQEYIAERELGFVVLEFHFPDGTTRAIGQALFKKSPKDFRRELFSLRVDGPIPFEQLPIVGLSENPAKSLDAFFAFIGDVAQNHPLAVDFVRPKNQREWQEHLVSVNLDPLVYRSHLRMNADEGGLLNFFNFPTTDDFVRTLLAMTYDPVELADDVTAADQTATAIEQYRHKALNRPLLEATEQFAERMLAGLNVFQIDVQRSRQARRHYEASRHEIGRLVASCTQRLAQLKESISDINGEIKQLQAQIASARSARESHQKYLSAYERIRDALAYNEAEAALKQARENETTANREHRVFSAAQLLQQQRAEEHTLAVLREQKRATEEEHRPELEELRKVGATYRASLDQVIQREQGRIATLSASLKSTQAAVEQAQADLGTLRERLGRAKTAMTNINGQLKAAENERRKLRDAGLILTDERPVDALDRLTATVASLIEQVNVLQRDADAALARAGVLNEEALSNERKAAEAEIRASKVRNELRLIERRRGDLQADPILQEMTTEKVDPFNPALPLALRERLNNQIAARRRLAIEGARDERVVTLYRPPGEPVYPPPLDVDEVMRMLKKAGVSSALPVYRWLSLNVELGEAVNLLREHPSVYSGILIQDPEEFRKARELTDAESIEIPITISTPDMLKELSVGSTGIVVVPAERGLINARLADTGRSGIEERVKVRRNEEKRLEGQEQRHATLLDQIEGFLRECPQERFESLTTQIADIETEVNAFKEAAERQEASAKEAANEAKALNSHARVTMQQREIRAGEQKTLRRYITDYDDHLPAWRAEERALTEELAQIDRDMQEANGLIEQGKEELSKGQEQRMQMQLELRTLTQDAAALSDDHVAPGGKASPDRTIDDLKREFVTRLDGYNRVIQRTELDGRIAEVERNVSKARSSYTTAASGLDEADIEIAYAFDPIAAHVDDRARLWQSANAARAICESEFKKLKRPTPLTRDERETTHPEWDKPGTSGEAAELGQRCLEIMAQKHASIETDSALLGARQETLRKLDKTQSHYTSSIKRLTDADGGEQTNETHAEFTGDPVVDEVLFDRKLANHKEHYKELERSSEKEGRTWEDRVIKVLEDPVFDPFAIEARMSLRQLGRTEISNDPERFIRNMEETLQVTRHTLEEQQRDRANVIRAMDGVAGDARTILKRAETRSHMPESIPAWANKPFLKIQIPAKGDERERHTLLGRLLDGWAATQQGTVPAGPDLAHACMMAVLGHVAMNGKVPANNAITVDMLKPEFHPRYYYHSIVKLKTFSGGEQVTAAIILYCILARVRAVKRGTDRTVLAQDSGFLLLDNPVGKASLPDFVDLQLDMAERLGVQFICGTGVNDFEALGAFPKLIKMRNDSVNPRTGASIVEVEPASNIRVAALGNRQPTRVAYS